MFWYEERLKGEMMSEVFCHKHNLKPEDERWKVLMEELTNPDVESCESFKGEICPQCYVSMKDRLTEAKRNLKVESREAIALRAENDRLQAVLDAVVRTVKELSGQDAIELSHKEYVKYPTMPCTMEQGDIRNILPNLIVELANKGLKK